MRFRIWAILTVAMCFRFSIPEVRACEIHWTIPNNHFDGVDEFGHVSYWEKVDELGLGDGWSVPLNIGFKSNRNWKSPYLGAGWLLALLDSRFEQTSENGFDMIQPDGWIRPFGRGNVNDRVLSGAGGWKAEINGDVIAASAPCGWRLVFVKGKLRSITTPRNRTLTLNTSSDGFVTTLQDGTAEVLRAEMGMHGQVKALVYGNEQKRIEIDLGKKPRVESINGQNVVAGLEESLAKLKLPDGRVRRYEFGVDSQVRPTLKITEANIPSRLITWDPATERIVADNNWAYSISAPNGLAQNADIERTNSGGQKEIWFHDPVGGREINQSASGEKKITTWFTAGTFAGKLRKIETFSGDGQKMITESYAYDELGNLVRSKGGQLQTRYAAKGYISQILVGDVVVVNRITSKNSN